MNGPSLGVPGLIIDARSSPSIRLRAFARHLIRSPYFVSRLDHLSAPCGLIWHSSEQDACFSGHARILPPARRYRNFCRTDRPGRGGPGLRYRGLGPGRIAGRRGEAVAFPPPPPAAERHAWDRLPDAHDEGNDCASPPAAVRHRVSVSYTHLT